MRVAAGKCRDPLPHGRPILECRLVRTVPRREVALPALRHSRVPTPIPPCIQHSHPEVSQPSRLLELDDPLGRANEGILHDVLGDGEIVSEEKRKAYQRRVVCLEARTKSLVRRFLVDAHDRQTQPSVSLYEEHRGALPGCTPVGTRHVRGDGAVRLGREPDALRSAGFRSDAPASAVMVGCSGAMRRSERR